MTKKVQRAEFVDFDTGTDGINTDIIAREGVNVCPFDGRPCHSGGCMACDDGVRCCRGGETCMLDGKTNWCTAFRGGGVSTGGGGGDGMMKPKGPDTVSFWEMR